jgi:heptosyltransferase-2
MNAFEKPVPSCKRFSGYKPCFPDHNCWLDGCKDNIPIGTKITIINLDAIGDVLMTTAQLRQLKENFRNLPFLDNIKIHSPFFLIMI